MDFSDFVGLPWRDRGRTADGYDCWGLVRAAFAAGTGIELPSHADAYATAADRAETALVYAGEVGDWRDVGTGHEQAYDVASLRIAHSLHVGLIVRRGLMLHMPRGRTSVIEPLARYRTVLTGIHRHRSQP